MRPCLCCLLLAALPTVCLSAEGDVAALLEQIKSVGPEAAGHAQAQEAWKQLAQADAGQLPQILAALQDAPPLAANWIRAAVDVIAERTVKQGRKLPQAELEAFAMDARRHPRARRLAYEWLARVDATAADRVIPKLLHDPSVEFRRDAVARLLEAEAKLDSGDKSARVKLLREALGGARDRDQVEVIAGKLKELGEDVDLAEHFGFVLNWRLVGPFDNVGGKGYAVAYPPEENSAAPGPFAGKAGSVKWFEHFANEDYGVVDLNKAIGKHMGAIGYAVTTFEADAAREVELRIGSPCAIKVWLNGKLLGAHEVYHANSMIDQYTARGQLKTGKNVILVKCCQNEQTEPWAQEWQFQLRVCDAAGTAVLARNRPPRPAAPANAGAAKTEK